MTWFDWVLVAIFGGSGLLSVGFVGRPREPLEPVNAVVIVLVDAALIVGVVLVR